MKVEINKAIKNQSGQIVVENLLLLVLMVGITSLAFKTLRQQEVVRSLLGAPWGKLSGMIQCGTWSKLENGQRSCAAGNHPMSRDRNISLKPGG